MILLLELRRALPESYSTLLNQHTIVCGHSLGEVRQQRVLQATQPTLLASAEIHIITKLRAQLLAHHSVVVRKKT